MSESEKIVGLNVYVESIFLSRDDTVETTKLKKMMGDVFEIKYLENLKYFLEMEVADQEKESLFHKETILLTCSKK